MRNKIIQLLTIYFQGDVPVSWDDAGPSQTQDYRSPEQPQPTQTQPMPDFLSFGQSQPTQDFAFDGSQLGTVYTQDYRSPEFFTQEEPLPEDRTRSYAESAAASIFGPSEEIPPFGLFGQIVEETPPQPQRQYTPAFGQASSEIQEEDDSEEESLGRGKRHKVARAPYTPPT